MQKNDPIINIMLDNVECIGEGQLLSGVRRLMCDLVINHKDDAHGAAEILAEGNFHSLPVINDDSDILGIVTSTGLIHYHNDQYYPLI